jgi:hypothetical protein
MADLRVGASQVVITPPIGTWLEGYGARTSGSTGIHDDLHARALVVDDGTTQASIISCDLIGVDRHQTAAVREIVAAETDIPADRVMLAATHTHAGPRGMHRQDDGTLRDVLSRQIAGAVVDAWHRKRPVVLKAGRGNVDSVSQNRRDPEGSVDYALRVLLFDSASHQEPPVASVVNFACHPTVLYHTNMLISADYPGEALRAVRDLTGCEVSLFLNGTCGDVNPAWIEQDYAEVARVGGIVGAEAARRLLELRPLGHEQRVWSIRWEELTPKNVASGSMVEPRVRVARRDVEVRLRALDDPASYTPRLAELQHQLQALKPGDVPARRTIMAQITKLRSEQGVAAQIRAPNPLRAEVQAIGLGADCAILALPGEFFVETGQLLQQAASVEHLLIACYANHHLMYIVPRHEFARGGYEPGVAMLDEDAEEAFRAAALEVLREVTSP